MKKLNSLKKKLLILKPIFGKAWEITTYFYRTIENLKENYSQKDYKKVRTELSELCFRPQTSQENALNPLSEKEKEKHELKAKLLAQRPVIQHTGFRTLDISSNMFYKTYCEAGIIITKTILANSFYYQNHLKF